MIWMDSLVELPTSIAARTDVAKASKFVKLRKGSMTDTLKRENKILTESTYSV